MFYFIQCNLSHTRSKKFENQSLLFLETFVKEKCREKCLALTQRNAMGISF